MRWVTLMTTDHVEHTIDLDTVVQISPQPGGAEQVQLTNGATFLIGAPQWTAKLHEQMQCSRGLS